MHWPYLESVCSAGSISTRHGHSRTEGKLVAAMKFESKLARRITNKESGFEGALAIAGAVFAVFLVLNVASGSIAGQNAVIQIGSKSSVARYLGQFDGKANVVMLGAQSNIDWIGVKIPFNGHLSDIKSISFSEFVAQTGGSDALEPYVLIRLTEGRMLICDPVSSYADGVWDLPLMEWQSRDTASKGNWTYHPQEMKPSAERLSVWIQSIGDSNVLSISIYIGRWSIESTYMCYIGDLTINEKIVDLSNAARIKTSSNDLPPGF